MGGGLVGSWEGERDGGGTEAATFGRERERLASWGQCSWSSFNGTGDLSVEGE